MTPMSDDKEYANRLLHSDYRVEIKSYDAGHGGSVPDEYAIRNDADYVDTLDCRKTAEWLVSCLNELRFFKLLLSVSSQAEKATEVRRFLCQHGGMADRWSFDDLHIGRSKGNALRTKEVPRPAGMRKHEWYKHAGAVCNLLNNDKLFTATTAVEEPGVTVPDLPIPLGVYYSPATDTFHSTVSYAVLGSAFYESWRSRRDEFPVSWCIYDHLGTPRGSSIASSAEEAITRYAAKKSIPSAAIGHWEARRS